MMIRKRFLFAGLAIALLGTGTALALGGRLAGPPELHGTLLDPPLPAAEFALQTAGGAATGPQDFRGRLVVLFFGFTHCPDVCPLTMQRLGAAMQELGDRADQVQVILVSVDPERDPPDAIDAYAKRFHPGFLGVSGTEEEVRAVASAYGMFFARNEVGGAAGYTVDHSASTLVLDRDGQLRMIWPFDTTSEKLASDLRYLIRR
jgi:protein SCO1